MSQAELAESVRWEAESFFPAGQGLDSYALDYYLIEERAGEGNMDVVLVACRKDKLEAYVKLCCPGRVQPQSRGCGCFLPVQNAYEINTMGAGRDEVVALVNMGRDLHQPHHDGWRQVRVLARHGLGQWPIFGKTDGGLGCHPRSS